ncbi:MAG: histidine kinase, partial [Parasporobacterium sp.]|nr:histidine kinase [Parasporobacterium sp.]
AYLCKMYVWQGRLAGTFISLDRLMNYEDAASLGSMELALTDEKDTVWATVGETETSQTLGEVYVYDTDKNTITISHRLRDDLGRIYLKTSFDSLTGEMNWGVVAVFGIILWTILFCVILTRTIKNEILSPMQSLQKDMAYIEQGNYDFRITKNFRNREFDNLRTAFNSMLDEIVGLKISRYEKQVELSDSELRSIRFQIRPHFFLNALTTISSLSLQGKNEEIAKYIEALSKNVRYMFKSGLHTVELDEELKHVENYFEMQELKYPGSVFYFISVEDSLRSWQIPQMLIHTIIENEYKYAVSMDDNLSIFINITQVTKEGEDLLCIEIEDDGKGYPEQILKDWSNESSRSQDGSRVGLLALHRMLALMYERNDLFEIENIDPHGA